MARPGRAHCSVDSKPLSWSWGQLHGGGGGLEEESGAREHIDQAAVPKLSLAGVREVIII